MDNQICLYFMVGVNEDGENIDLFVDATGEKEALRLYDHYWEETLGPPYGRVRIFQTPHPGTRPKVLQWHQDVIEGSGANFP